MLSHYYRHLAQSTIIHIDTLINRQINSIMHSPRFQQLEASWRGLYYLVHQVAASQGRSIKLKVLTLTWYALSKDLMRAVEFDQSQLFAKIYNTEFGQPGGEPFGLLIGDYYINHRNTANNNASDMIVLQNIARIAAAAFAPFVAAVAPALLGLDDFTDLDRPLDLERTFQQTEYLQWKALRNDEDARFAGLVLPQVLMRLPYHQSRSITYPFSFTEDTSVSQRQYLWGNAVYCLAAVMARAFNRSGWFADIRSDNSSSVTDLPQAMFATDAEGIAQKYSTPVGLTDRKEKLLSDFGFIALTENQYDHQARFYAFPTIQKAQHYDRANARQNADLSSMLHYILCVSRFAHYIKIIARDKMGSFATAEACEHYLQNWLHQYTAASADLSDALKARYPLKEAAVRVHEMPGSPGKYLCTIHLSPHYQWDEIETYLQLKTELSRGI